MSKTIYLHSAILALSLFRAKYAGRKPSIFTMWLDVALLDLHAKQREITRITLSHFAERAMIEPTMTTETGKTN